jgi:hypothetical protein
MKQKLWSTVALMAALAALQSTPSLAQSEGSKGGTQAAQELQPGQGTVHLSADQQTRIRDSILAGNNVPRVESTNFSIRVGTVVPTSIRVTEVPATLLEMYPQWRGYSYFVVHDDIIIVDQGHRIIAVVAVGSGGASR